ncbi:MAG: ParB/RepB/Spo0J family partition protein [Bacteroidales bacterium]|nr:ParB/RepB/Spo0J family partition protein [Bacteroidales bacterium]
MAKLVKQPLTWFKFNPQVRRHFDESGLPALGESLKVRQIQPVLAKPDGTLIAGERRFRAAALVGMTELEVIISDEPLTDTQIKVVQLAENVHRADLKDIEKYKGCEELLRLNPGWNNKALAEHLHLSESAITKYLSPSRCIPEVQQALEAGRIGIAACYEISRVPADQQSELLHHALDGASRDELAKRVRKPKQADTPQVRMKRIVCPLSSGVSITVSGADLSLDDFIESLSEAQKEARKAREQSLDAKTFSAVMKDKAKKGAGQ